MELTVAKRTVVWRTDGEPINVLKKRGQLFVCSLGCCCGRTDKGFAPVPQHLHHQEWERRKLRNKVHLTQSGCLGPCSLANVILLIFDGQPVWFHSINDEPLILAVYDYLEAMVSSDRYLQPPAALLPLVFDGFTWAAESETG
jgi:cobaltochelatase CobN